MKHASSVLLIALVLLICCIGTACTNKISGEVIAVDAAQGTLTVQAGTVAAAFACETGPLTNEVKVGDKVTVHYKEEGGKKITTKITHLKKKASTGC